MQQFVARVATLQARQFYQVTLSGYLGNAIQQVMAALIMSLLFWAPRNTIAVIITLHKLTTLPVMVMPFASFSLTGCDCLPLRWRQAHAHLYSLSFRCRFISLHGRQVGQSCLQQFSSVLPSSHLTRGS